jgi:polyhydroxyalkanoate synthesis regulator phasin
VAKSHEEPRAGGADRAPGSDPGDADEPAGTPGGERVGESLRAAVERTLAATAGGASGTRRRAQELVDEVARRGQAAAREAGSRSEAARDEVLKRGESAREQVARRGESAREEIERRSEGAGARLAEALSNLRGGEGGEQSPVLDRLARIERRLGSLEQVIGEPVARGGDESPAEAQANSQAEAEDNPTEADEQAVSWDPREGSEGEVGEAGGGEEKQGGAGRSGA